MNIRTIAVAAVGVALSSVLCGTSAFAGLPEGVAAYAQGDFATAFREFSRAAEQGNVLAQAQLGGMYLNGEGIPQDYSKAVEWLHKAAEQGNTNAQGLLGAIYAEGKGVPQDYRKATQWFRESAEHGNAIAQGQLGAAYLVGRGVPQDYVLGYAWLNVAAVNGDKDTQRIRDIATSKMTPSQLEEAQALSRKYFEMYVVPFRGSQ